MRLRNAIKQSCDIYFYEVARLLGVDRLSILAKRYGLGSKVLGDLYIDEKIGIVPSTKWKLENLDLPWYLGETIITGIGQGYIQSTPLQLCLMTAQLANGGYKIKPQIILDETNKKSKETTYDFSWKKNDLVMVDNKRFMLGRRAFKKGDKRDLVVIQSSLANFGYGSTTRKKINQNIKN